MSYRPTSIRSVFLLAMVGAAAGSIVLIGALLATTEIFSFRREATSLRSRQLETEKTILRREVDRVVDFVQFQKSRTESRVMDGVRARAYDAYAVLSGIYDRLRGTSGPGEIEQIALEALRPVRFNDGRGYYFVTSLDGIARLSPDQPEQEGTSVLELRDTRGRYVAQEMIAIARESGEGYYRFTWTRPDSQGHDYAKIAFVKRFDPFDWLVGTGEYLDDTERQVQAEVLEWISDIRFGREGYVFAGREDGVSLTEPGRGRNMFDTVDAGGVKIVQELIRKAKEGGGFVQYVMPPIDGKRSAPKLSYARWIEDWKWYIGAGMYIDEIEQVLSARRAELEHALAWRLAGLLLVLGVLLAASLATVRLLARRIQASLGAFSAYFAEAADGATRIEPASVGFDEFATLAEAANAMSARRRTAEEALRASESKYREIVENLPDGLVFHDLSANVLEVNESACRLLGYERSELIGAAAHTLEHPEERDANAAMFERVLAEGAAQFECRMRRKDGTLVPVEVTARLVTRGTRALIQAMLRDLTQRHRNEEEKRALEAQLLIAQKMESVGRLAGGVAHDMNNALLPILAYSELLAESMEPADPRREQVAEITMAAEHARGLMRQLLAFGRKPVLELTSLDLGTTILRFEKLLRRTIREDISIGFSVPAGLPPVRGDAGQIEQVLVNLAVNAQDAMPAGGVLAIELADVVVDDDRGAAEPGLAAGRYVRLTVSDTGTGIDPRVVPQIFEPFFTTKPSGMGTGLGLSIVYGIVKQHGGRITVDSTPGAGTVFTIFLPAASEAAGDQPRVAEPAVPLATGSESMLLVEDNEAVRELAARILRRLGYRVIAVGDPSVCEEILAREPDGVRLLLTDIVMPGMSGTELFARLSALDPSLKVLYMSGYAEELVASHGVLEPGVRFLQKPFTMQTLAAKVREAIDV
jgi:two-component system, cell cycle sensor histidine kinase and response regulator CckA